MKKVIVIVALLLVLVLLAGLIAGYIAAAKAYSSKFNYRCTTTASKSFSMDEFPEMERDRHTFATLQGHTLVGYLYRSNTNTQVKGVVVFAHGLGAGGQVGYLSCFDYLTRNGYLVFAYDATGNDESGGDAVGGLPQGYVDMDHAVTYAQSLPETQSLPFILMGYSWGGLSTVNTLNTHPEVKAAVAIAGWNEAIDLVAESVRQSGNKYADLILPFVKAYEVFHYGPKYAFSTGMKGFAKSDCGVMIIHGELDGTVPISAGYDIYYEKYQNDPRFTFKRYSDRGHTNIFSSGKKLDEALFAEIVTFCDNWVQ